VQARKRDLVLLDSVGLPAMNADVAFSGGSRAETKVD
jgi:hypothetical protein